MNPLQQLYMQAILKQQTQDKQQQVKQEEVSSRQSIQYLQKQQLLHILQQSHTPTIQESTNTTTLLDVQNRITQYFQQCIVRKQQITIQEVLDQQLPYFMRVIGNLLIHGLKNIQADSEILTPLLQQYQQQPMKISLSSSLFQTVAILFRSQLVFQDQGTKYLSKFLLFREEFCETFFNTLYCYQILNGQTVSQQIGFTQILQLVKKSQEDVWTTFVYKLLSQQQQKLTKEVFLQQFNNYTTLINNYFKKSNLIMDVVETSVKLTNQFHHDEIFQNYLLVMGNFKATTQDFLKKATIVLFDDQDQDLDLMLFSTSASKLHKQMNSQLLYVLPYILQLESQLIDYISAKQGGDVSSVKNSSNYYLKMIEKLKSKCVYNGEEDCNCKKCQCIRRNRNSAKESQKKKREALEKLGPLQDEYETLAKKVKCIEDENEMLRQLLIDVFKHPAVQKISSQFIEPLTKVIQDNESAPRLSEC